MKCGPTEQGYASHQWLAEHCHLANTGTNLSWWLLLGLILLIAGLLFRLGWR
jgi:LPXTG-motif cell wall-anchored protein